MIIALSCSAERELVLHQVEDQDPSCCDCFVEFGWLLLTQAPSNALSNWVSEFYAIVATVCEDDPHPVIHVVRLDTPLNATTINEVLEVP